MTEEQFAEFLAFGREQFGVEFKGPGPRTDKHLLAKVIRAVLGMANRQDGGRVIIGIDEDAQGLPVPTGLTKSDVETWGHDDFADSLATYVDPYVTFDLEVVPYDGHDFVVITVREFEEIPILCKRDYADKNGRSVLRNGACYVRSRRKPETVEVSSHSDMRDLLELSITKGIRKFLARAQDATMLVAHPVQPTDAEQYDQQLGDLK